ncbi:MAG: hypothetical protein KME31_31300 [Tolypothrix carrinoi HA7290-LM1]|jgi:hypothetical protein|nr:hypothetical protein [Tolypothrix carrinoi HA7290-LM1]
MNSPPGRYMWLIGIAAVITAISPFFISHKPITLPGETAPPGDTKLPTPEPTPEQSEIESVVDTSYITFRNALKNLNKDELRKSYTGEALKARERLIEANSQLPTGEKLSFINMNYDYSKTNFENYQAIHNEKVKIKASKKVNNVTYWLYPNRCIGYQPEHIAIHDFTLEKTSTGWLISNFKSLHEIANIIYNQGCPVS